MLLLNLGTPDWTMWDDGWTVVTADGRRSAQFEHTLLVTADGVEIMTVPSGRPERREPVSQPRQAKK